VGGISSGTSVTVKQLAEGIGGSREEMNDRQKTAEPSQNVV